jgi:hypothetical protein
MKNDIDNLKLDVNNVHETVKRCESELARASRRQSYTARGVRLLISCVGALMPANASLASELTKFNKQSSGSFDADDETATNAVGVVEEMKKKYEKSHHLPRSISEVDDAGDSPEDIVTPKKQMAPSSNIKSPMTPQQEAMGDSQKSLDEVRALLAGVGGSALNMVSPVKGY